MLNEFKSKLENGEFVYGVFVKTSDPMFNEIIGISGYDYVILDTEHGPTDIENQQNNIRACELRGILPIVRVPYIDDNVIGKALDILHTIQKAVIFSEDDLLYAYDYGVVDKKMFPTIDDLRKAITAFQVDGECVSIQKDEINYPISPSVLQEINAEYNGRNLLDVVGNMIHLYPEQRRFREQRCIDIYGKLI